MTDLYEDLGVDPESTTEEIKRAYKRKLHPVILISRVVAIRNFKKFKKLMRYYQ